MNCCVCVRVSLDNGVDYFSSCRHYYYLRSFIIRSGFSMAWHSSDLLIYRLTLLTTTCCMCLNAMYAWKTETHRKQFASHLCRWWKTIDSRLVERSHTVITYKILCFRQTNKFMVVKFWRNRVKNHTALPSKSVFSPLKNYFFDIRLQYMLNFNTTDEYIDLIR